MPFHTALPLGTRVRVRRDPQFGPGPWPSEPTGTLVVGPDGKQFSEVSTQQGIQRTYWVRFDEPQLDPDGDGPYESSQVLEKYIELLAR